MPDIPQEVREAAANLYLDLEGEPYSPRDLKVADDHRSGLLDDHPSIIAFHAFQKATIAKAMVEAGEMWQPRETAPKDGTTIDVWRDGLRETVYWGLPPHHCGELGSYCDSDWHGLKEEGWICATFGEFVGGEHNPFTHWKPYPVGPETCAETRHVSLGDKCQKAICGES